MGILILVGLLAPEAAKWNNFLPLPNLQGLWGLFFQLILFFSVAVSPHLCGKKYPASGLPGIHSQGLSSEDTASRNSWVSWYQPQGNGGPGMTFAGPSAALGPHLVLNEEKLWEGKGLMA